MEQNKDITNEELIAIAKENDNPMERVGDLNDAQRFAMAHDIYDGEVRNRTSDIYAIYKKWAKNPIDKFSFGRQMNQRFKGGRTGAGRYYLLNRKLSEKKEA